MSRSVQQLPGIILETVHSDYSMAELAAGQVEFQTLMDSQPMPVTWIADLREAPLAFTQSFLPMIVQMFNQVPPHPKLRRIVYVLSAELVPSGFPIPVFETLEAALDSARSE